MTTEKKLNFLLKVEIDELGRYQEVTYGLASKALHTRSLKDAQLSDVLMDFAKLMKKEHQKALRSEYLAMARRRAELSGRLHCFQAERRANIALDMWALLLPARIANEDLGDYQEDIERRGEKGQSTGLYIRALAAIFWTGVNAVGYFLRKIGMRKAG